MKKKPQPINLFQYIDPMKYSVVQFTQRVTTVTSKLLYL